jgi:hypothetical protein
MSFPSDLAGAIVVPLVNINPPPAIGDPLSILIPIGNWKIQTDGIVLFSLTEGAVNQDNSQIIFPEMAEFTFYNRINQNINLAMANVGTCRVVFYPRSEELENVEQLRSRVPGGKC